MRTTTLATHATRPFLALAAALALASPSAWAAQKHHGRDDGGLAEEREESPAGGLDRKWADASAEMDDDKEAADDDGSLPQGDRTPEQRQRRDQLVAKELELLSKETHREPRRRVSSRERQAIGLHWRHVMRLSRIRELAEKNNDKAVVASASALMELADKKFAARMDELLAEGERMDAGKR